MPKYENNTYQGRNAVIFKPDKQQIAMDSKIAGI